MLPKHLKEVPEDRKAIAPYNFVELPDKVVEAELPLPDGDRYNLNRHTGKIKCTLTTESPLYTRCGLTKDEFEQGKEAKDLPDFFYTELESEVKKPVIPGSSLRGTLRNLVEIVSFGKVERVTKNKLFYRSLGDPTLKDIYMSNFVENLGQVQHSPHPKAPCYRSKIRTGFLRKRSNSYMIEECGYGRIDRKLVNRVIPTVPSQPLYQGSGPGKTPNWTYQQQTVYVEIDLQEQDYFFPRQVNRNGNQRHPNLYLRYKAVHSASFTQSHNTKTATLVITGDMQHKHLEFVFLHETINEYEVSDEILQRFHDDDQITKWQEDAYTRNSPNFNCRAKNGHLRDGEPVFFLLDEEQQRVRFLGRAQMFRLPYELSPFDFVPEILRDTLTIDLADAIFGFVRNEKREKDQALAGRVFISDAVCEKAASEDIWFTGNPERTITPQILSTPKPTTFQHYLVQTDPEAKKRELKHYANKPEEETVIRGHKLYWHKGRSPSIVLDNPEASESQTTEIKPIKAGVYFTFTIDFENLSDVELGAILWVLNLAQDEEYRLSLGMGKPLGMGAVKITHQLHLSDRQQRYTKLFKDSNWNIPEISDTSDTHERCVKAFEKYVLDHISEADQPTTGKATGLEELPRIKMLLAVLSWAGPSDIERTTRYMEIQRDRDPKLEPDGKEYKERRVLPTPLQVMEWEDNRKDNNPNLSPQPRAKVGKPVLKKSTQPNRRTGEGGRDDRGSSDRAFARPPKPPKR